MSRKYIVATVLLIVIGGVWLIVIRRRMSVDTSPEYRLMRTQSIVAMVGDVLMTYRQEVGRFPSSEEGLGVLSQGNGTKEPFMRSAEDIRDSWGQRLVYRRAGSDDRPPFHLYSLGPNGKDDGGDSDDISFWSEPVQGQLPK